MKINFCSFSEKLDNFNQQQVRRERLLRNVVCTGAHVHLICASEEEKEREREREREREKQMSRRDEKNNR